MHSLNVCTLSMMLGHAFELDEDQLECLGMGAMFHDLGLWESERTHNGSIRRDVTQRLIVPLKQHPTLGKSMARSGIRGLPPVLRDHRTASRTA